jgi:hypothetical protein
MKSTVDVEAKADQVSEDGLRVTEDRRETK